MVTAESVKAKMRALIDVANATTGKSDTDLSSAVDSLVEGFGGSGGGSSVKAKDVNFYDYDGTLLHSYTVAEAKALSKLPALPEREGLICQGWNWSLEGIKEQNSPLTVGATYITDDGTTRIHIHLEEGRTSPIVGMNLTGTVIVDWGDGTEPDTLVNTKSYSTLMYTPTHNYSKPGDYVIRLTVDGKMYFGGSGSSNHGAYILRYNDSGYANRGYNVAVRKIEIGNGVDRINEYSFYGCHLLQSITIPNSVTKIDASCFIENVNIKHITIPNGITKIEKRTFKDCYYLASVAIPESVTAIEGYAFQNAAIRSVYIPKSCEQILELSFGNCRLLSSIIFGNGIKTIASTALGSCKSLLKVAFPPTVLKISGFSGCSSVVYYDFTRHTAVPTLTDSSAFYEIPEDCEIRVPAALYDEWIAATNWATYAANIVAV